MSDGDLKYKVTVSADKARREIRLTAAEMENLSKRAAAASASAAAKTTGFSAAAASARTVVGGLTGVIRGATRALGLFRAALGVFGAISSIVMAAITLWREYRDRAERAAEAQAEVAQKLADARKKVEELNQARLDRAKNAMRAFADEISRARDNANALSSAVADLASAQAEFDSSQIDLAVSRGGMTREEGDLAKARIATEAAFAARDADTDQKLQNRQAAQAVVDNYRHMHPDLTLGEDGRVDVLDSEAYRKYASAQRQTAIHSGNTDEAAYRHQEEIARQNFAAFIETARGYEKALASLEVATKEYDAALLKGDAAINKAAAAEKEKSAAASKAESSALEKSERERAKAQVDWEVQRGDKTASAGALEKQRIDLEAELKAAKEAFEARRKADEEAGRDTETDDVLAALNNAVVTLQTKLDTVNDQERKDAEGAGKGDEPEMVRASVDAWQRLGAVTGRGASGANGAVEVAKKHLMVANKHTDLMRRSAERLAKIQDNIAKLEATT